MPVPIVRDGFEVLGKTLSARSIDNHKYSWQRDHSCAGVYKGTGGQKNMILFYTNGMATNYKQFNKNLKFISEVFNGSDVHFVYNGSRGLMYDTGESIIMKCGVSMNPDKLMTSYVKQIFNDFDKLDPNKKIKMLVLCHSHGGITTYNAGRRLEKKYCERMDVATFGSATTIPEDIFKNSVNYFNRTDFVPFADLFDRLGIFNNYNIVILDDCSFGEHGLLQGSYSRGMNRVKDDYKDFFLK